MHVVLSESKWRVWSHQYLQTLRLHHVLNLCFLCFCLCTRQLSGIVIFSWLFEVPGLLLRYRELCIVYEVELQCPMTPAATRLMWTYLPIFWHVFRTGPCLFWPLSLVFWRSQLGTLGVFNLIVYNCFGASLVYMNYTSYHLLPRYKVEDALRSGIVKLSSARPSAGEALVVSSVEDGSGDSKVLPNWTAYLKEEPCPPSRRMHSIPSSSLTHSHSLPHPLPLPLSLPVIEKEAFFSFLAVIVFPIPMFFFLTLFSKGLVARSATSTTDVLVSSSSFASVLAISFDMALTQLMLIFLLLLPWMRTQTACTGASLLLVRRTHVRSAALLFYLFVECSAVVVSQDHKTGNSHFYRITLLGSFALEVLARWVGDNVNREMGCNLWVLLRQPLPAALFAWASVYVDALGFGLTTPTCDGAAFFMTNCDSEPDKRQTFMCLVFLAVVAGRACFCRLLARHPVDRLHATCWSRATATAAIVCAIATSYGVALSLMFNTTNSRLGTAAFAHLDITELVIGLAAALLTALSLVQWMSLETPWKCAHWMWQLRLVVLWLVLWSANLSDVEARSHNFLLLLAGTLANLVIYIRGVVSSDEGQKHPVGHRLANV